MELLKKSEKGEQRSGTLDGSIILDSDTERSFDRYLEREFPNEVVAKEILGGTAFGEFSSIVNNKR